MYSFLLRNPNIGKAIFSSYLRDGANKLAVALCQPHQILRHGFQVHIRSSPPPSMPPHLFRKAMDPQPLAANAHMLQGPFIGSFISLL